LKLDQITTGMMRKAVDVYIAAAYERSPLPVTVKSRVAFLSEHTSEDLRDVLSHDLIERAVSEEDAEVVDCYAIRLGNERYPHMKLALCRQEGDDYRLVVLPHDRHFEVESTNPDAPRAEALKGYNRRLKEEIEARWCQADLPTIEEP